MCYRVPDILTETNSQFHNSLDIKQKIDNHRKKSVFRFVIYMEEIKFRIILDMQSGGNKSDILLQNIVYKTFLSVTDVFKYLSGWGSTLLRLCI